MIAAAPHFSTLNGRNSNGILKQIGKNEILYS